MRQPVFFRGFASSIAAWPVLFVLLVLELWYDVFGDKQLLVLGVTMFAALWWSTFLFLGEQEALKERLETVEEMLRQLLVEQNGVPPRR